MSGAPDPDVAPRWVQLQRERTVCGAIDEAARAQSVGTEM